MMRRAAVWVAALTSAATMIVTVPGAADAAGHPGYSSPGYHWDGTLPKVAPVVPGKLVSLGDGIDPHVLVDAAGTAQVAYTTQPDQLESVLHDCVLQRGQTSCASNQGLLAPATTPQYSVDDAGPTPLALGNELLMLDYRYPDQQTLPDGTTGSPTFLWTSEDGGRSFTGPGDVGHLNVSGNAVVFGGADPQIAWITDTTTGGTFFASAPAGTYQPATLNLGDQGPDEAYNGRLALDGDRPVAEFTDLTGHVFIREWNGTGDIMSSSSWSVARLDGTGYPRLVGGPAGVYLLYQKQSEGGLYVQRIVDGQPSGAAVQVVADHDFSHVDYSIAETASGALTVGYFTEATKDDLYTTTSTDGGRHWSVPQVIARNLTGPSQLSLDAAGDGGGVAAFEVPSTTASRHAIEVAPFGTFAANGLKGLGNLDGTGAGGLGGDPDASASCSDVSFGDIDATTQGRGCFLRDPSNPTSGAAISLGEIRLNGLQIIPNAGVKIVIDPRRHTIDTTGTVSVALRAPGIGDITLYKGELHVGLGNLDHIGDNLFDFTASGVTSKLEGFPIDGSIDAKIVKGGVDIPISLKLPPYMGAITGNALLHATNSGGLDLGSLEIKAADVVLGALEIKDLDISYTETGNVWKGMAHLNIPAGSPYFGIDASVEFDDGDFTMGSFDVSTPFPGIPIFTDTYISGFGGGFDIHPGRRRFFGTIDVGAIPLDPPNYTLGIHGMVGLTFNDNGPVVLVVTGTGAIHGIEVAQASLTFTSDGIFEMTGSADLDFDVASISSAVNAYANLANGQFSTDIHGDLELDLGFDVDLSGIEGVVSSRGAGACGTYLGDKVGFRYAWGGAAQVFFKDCDLGPLKIQAPPVPAATAVAGRPVAAAVAVAPGSSTSQMEIHGAGGAPAVVLTDPAGDVVTPTVIGPGAAQAPAVAIPVPSDDVTYVSVPSPRAGQWKVSPAAGSVPITQILAARGYPAPALAARVTGHGRTRTLAYHVSAPPGATVSFTERGIGDRHGVSHTIGTAHGARGRLAFTPAAGPAGPRAIVAEVIENGVPAHSETIARYVAPAPPAAGRVGGLRVARHGARFTVSFGRAPGATHYLVRIVATDGHRYLRVIAAGPHRVTVPAIGYRDAVTATVTGISATQHPGPASRASARFTSAVYARAHRPARPRPARHRPRRRTTTADRSSA
jgi:hypothetical protein